MQQPQEYEEYYALNDHQRRSLTASNYFRLLEGEPIIQVPPEDSEYHRLWRWPEPQRMLHPEKYPFPYCELKQAKTMTIEKKSLLELTQEHMEIVLLLEELSGELTPEIEERLAINKEDLNERICAYQQIIADCDGKANAATEQINRLTSYKKKHEATIERLEYFLLNALKVFGQQDAKGIYRLEAATDENIVSLSSRKSQSVEITDKDQLPGEYWRIPEITPSPDKKLIADAIKSGNAVPGAEMVEHLNLVIK